MGHKSWSKELTLMILEESWMPRSGCGHQRVAEMSPDTRCPRKSPCGWDYRALCGLCSKNTNSIYVGFFRVT